MKKKNKIIYWIATLWLALGMLSTGAVQLLGIQEEQDMMVHLGYPLYLMALLGTWKVLGTIVLLIPRTPVLKEWAYAGFTFAMTGAMVSHWAVGDPVLDFFGPVLLLVLTLISRSHRPPERRTVAANTPSHGN